MAKHTKSRAPAGPQRSRAAAGAARASRSRRTGPAERVARLRREMQLTQPELAALLGTHAITVSRWERGAAAPQGALARLLDVLELARAKGRPLPADLDRSDPLQVLAQLISRACDAPDLDLALLSATNRLPGRVVALTRGDVMSKVVIEVAPEVRIAAVITTDSVDRLGLATGCSAVAVMKATEVMVAARGARGSAT